MNDMETPDAHTLRCVFQRAKDGDSWKLFEAAAWSLRSTALRLGDPDFLAVAEAFEICVDRWRSGRMDPLDDSSKPVLTLGQAFGISDRTHALGALCGFEGKVNRGDRIYWDCLKLHEKGWTKDAIFSEVASGSIVGKHRIKQLWYRYRESRLHNLIASSNWDGT